MKADSLIRTIDLKDASGQVIGSREVAFYAGLLSRAHELGLRKISIELIQIPTEANGQMAISRAVVETDRGCFEGFGDANPQNVESFLTPHLIRVAETRAKARALRDAVNVGVVSFEELDGTEFPPVSTVPGSGGEAPPAAAPAHGRNGNGKSRSTKGPPFKDVATATGPMSEAQRRYLFRLLASQGIQGDVALDHLKSRFGVTDLAQASKVDATRLIDQILKEAGKEVASNGSPQR
jgi:hypothetical protein